MSFGGLRADTDPVSTLRKVLLAMLLVSLTGSAFGAGTFASFTATTTNASSTFATGSLVLSEQKGAGNTCYSNNPNNANGAGTNTDSNANTGCDAYFAVSLAKPGDAASTQAVTIVNRGTLAPTNGLRLYGTSTCADGNTGSFNGTGSMCETLMMSIHNDTDSTCFFGGGAAEERQGTSVFASQTATLAVAGLNQITLNGTQITIAAGTYGITTAATNGTLAAAIQTAINAASLPAVVGVGVDGKISIANSVAGGAMVITAGTSDARALLGFSSPAGGTQTFDAAADAACSYSPAHSPASFSRKFTSANPATAAASIAANGGLKTYTVGLSLDTAASNPFQGRTATFGFTWSIAQ
jgi:hypothetical protein